MITMLSRVLEFICAVIYASGRSSIARWVIFGVCVIAFSSLVPLHQKRTEDTTIREMPAVYIRATMVNRYVRTTGKLINTGAYEVPVTADGLFWHTLRFVPFLTPNTREPLFIQGENLPAPDANGDTTLVGKMIIGEDELPAYYLQVMEPSNKLIYDALFWLCIATLVLVLLGNYCSWLVRKANYVLGIPWGLADNKLSRIDSGHFLLWFGGLGAGYGDVILRQVPVLFRAIPSEGRISPQANPDSWSVTMHRLLKLQRTTVATRYGPLVAVRIEFEDERGITRNGVIAASHTKLLQSMLDVMQYIGQ